MKLTLLGSFKRHVRADLRRHGHVSTANNMIMTGRNWTEDNKTYCVYCGLLTEIVPYTQEEGFFVAHTNRQGAECDLDQCEVNSR